MKRIFFVMAAILFVAGVRPVWAQQNEIAALRAEIAKQQVVIAQLLKRLEALEKADAARAGQPCRICRTTSRRRKTRSTRCARPSTAR